MFDDFSIEICRATANVLKRGKVGACLHHPKTVGQNVWQYPCFGVIFEVIFRCTGKNIFHSCDALKREKRVKSTACPTLSTAYDVPALRNPLISACAILPEPIKPINIVLPWMGVTAWLNNSNGKWESDGVKTRARWRLNLEQIMASKMDMI